MRRQLQPIALAAVFVVAATGGLLARQTKSTAKPATPATKSAGTTTATPSAAPPIAPTTFTTPPLVTTGYAGARPAGITRAVYDFAAQHPEVLKYVPCYCGCEADGHPHNESCFVKARDGKGNVTQWDMHGHG